MSLLFSIYTYTPWDGLKTQTLTQVKLLSLKSVFKSFPIVEQEFFDDLLSNIYNYNHYSIVKSIKKIVGPNGEDYDISNFSFVWAFDNQRRMYQFLFQKIKDDEDSRRILVALAPPELGKLFATHKKNAILRTLSLLINSKNMKFTMILTPKGKSIAEEQQIFQLNKKSQEKTNFMNVLKTMPNIQGNWFSSQNPRCPVCNQFLIEMKEYSIIGTGKYICPHCGFGTEL